MSERVQLFTRTQLGVETPLAVLEDAPLSSGAAGLIMLAQRAPGTAVASTSAAGDAAYMTVDAEGKTITDPHADPSQTRQSRTDLTTTSDVQLLASAGAGLRNYLTSITVENTGAAAARFLLRDNTTTIFSCTVPANDTRQFTFEMALRGSAATVVNGQLGAAGTVTVSLSGFAGV